MIAVALVLLCLAGLVALALSMPKHHRDLFGKAPPRMRSLALRVGSWAALAASFATAIADQGVSVGIVLWLGMVTITALAVAMLLTYHSLWWRA